MELTKKTKLSLILFSIILITLIAVILIKPLISNYFEEVQIQKIEKENNEKLATTIKWDSKNLDNIGVGQTEFTTKWEKDEMLYLLKLSKNNNPINFNFSILQIEFFDKDGFSAFRFNIEKSEFRKSSNSFGEIESLSINSKVATAPSTYLKFKSYQISWYN